MDKLLN